MASSEQWLKMWEEAFHHHHEDQPDKHETGHHHHCADGGEKQRASGPGHHGMEADKYLQRYLNSLTEGKDNLSVFVTLCGNSPDLAWLCDKGYEVVGCELSEKAVERLFENRVLGGKIEHEVKDEGEIKTFTATDGKKLKVYVGDFFGPLSPDQTGTFDCIWDSHGIISVPADLHVQYAEKVSRFLKQGGRMLFSTLNYHGTYMGRGPIPVSVSRLQELFPDFSVELLENSESPAWHKQKFGGDNWTNPVALLKRKDN